MSKTGLNQIAPADLVAEFGVDGFRYHFLPDQRFGPDGDFTYEGMVARYNSRPRQQLRQPRCAVSPPSSRSKCGGIGPAPSPTSRSPPLAATAYADAAAAWDGVAPSDALDATWRLIRETNAYLEANEPWKAEPGPGVDAVLGDALEALRIVARARLARDPARRRRGVATHRPARSADRPAPARGRGVGRLSRRAARRRRASRCSRGSTVVSAE